MVYGAGGKTTPKAGRNGTGSYHPEGTPLFLHRGNVFPGIVVGVPEANQLNFGNPSRAGIASVVGQDRSKTKAIMPIATQYNLATLPLAPAMVVSSTNDNNNQQPISPKAVTLSMPNERNTNTASGGTKTPNTYRTVFGASSTMASDTAFNRKPNANYVRKTKAKPGNTVEAVKKQASTRTFARMDKPLPVAGGLGKNALNRTPPPSFMSRNNLWQDPNNSFMAGRTSPGGNDTGTGRWSTVKRGVV